MRKLLTTVVHGGLRKEQTPHLYANNIANQIRRPLKQANQKSEDNQFSHPTNQASQVLCNPIGIENARILACRQLQPRSDVDKTRPNPPLF